MLLKGKALSLSREYGKGWTLSILLDDDSVENAKNAVDALKNDVPVEVKDYRRKRSLDANAYAWVLIGKIASTLRHSKLDVYRSYIRDLGDNFTFLAVQDNAAEAFRRTWEAQGDGWLVDEVPCKLTGCKKFCCYYGSSVYDSRLMSVLIDRLVTDAKELGIETLPPNELERMVTEWK